MNGNGSGVTRRGFLGASAGTALVGAAPAMPARPAPVRVTGGIVQGTVGSVPGVHAWLGIPFAAPPVGDLRWRPPQPVQPWSGALQGDRHGASPWANPAQENSTYYSHPSRMDEDCLTLNVWSKPSAKTLRPVMVWIFGGAFVGGTSDHSLYDGAPLAADDVVFVSINYRVGILGFFAHPELAGESGEGVSGNYGLMDQIAALRWVRDNISVFGGDPDNVTILGQSAGAFSVGFHLVMPQSRGLFHRGIAQSGAPMGTPSSFILLGEHATMARAGLDFQREVGATDLAELRKIPPARLVQANSHDWRFYPKIDGRLVPAHPFDLIRARRHADVPLIVGHTRDEGSSFPPLGDGTPAGLAAALGEVYGAQTEAARRLFRTTTNSEADREGRHVFGDIVFNWNAAALAVAMAEASASPVFAYQWDYAGAVPADRTFAEGKGSALGAFHGSEIGFVLATQPARGFGLSAAQRSLLRRASGWWTSFARDGTPDAAGKTWPRYRPGTSTILHIDAGSAVARPLADRARLELLGQAMGNRVVERA